MKGIVSIPFSEDCATSNLVVRNVKVPLRTCRLIRKVVFTCVSIVNQFN